MKNKYLVIFLIFLLILLFNCTSVVEVAEQYKEISWKSVEIADFQNGWQNFDPNVQPLQYGIDNDGILHIIGTIEDTTPVAVNQAVFTLPLGYRPSLTNHATISGIGTGRIVLTLSIFSDGTVNINGDNPTVAYIGHISIKL
ncbi:MAG: hypothetical protein JXB50_05625 [Spirochaetes bacterium]|nr:hypothetical protein [Spirochaetota bacterium]